MCLNHRTGILPVSEAGYTAAELEDWTRARGHAARSRRPAGGSTQGRALLVGESETDSSAGDRWGVAVGGEEEAGRRRGRIFEQHDEDHAGRCRVCFVAR